MNMFSPELRELDRNTVQYMIEEQEKKLEEQKKELAENQKELEAKDKLLQDIQAENIALKAIIEKLQK